VLLHEMLTGDTPYVERFAPLKLYESILRGARTAPCGVWVSPAATQLMNALLRRTPADRMVAVRSGAELVLCRHAFFAQARALGPHLPAPSSGLIATSHLPPAHLPPALPSPTAHRPPPTAHRPPPTAHRPPPTAQIEWRRLLDKELSPPHVPELSSALDASSFDASFEPLPVEPLGDLAVPTGAFIDF
jgi:hypothetical protein